MHPRSQSTLETIDQQAERNNSLVKSIFLHRMQKWFRNFPDWSQGWQAWAMAVIISKIDLNAIYLYRSSLSHPQKLSRNAWQWFNCFHCLLQDDVSSEWGRISLMIPSIVCYGSPIWALFLPFKIIGHWPIFFLN